MEIKVAMLRAFGEKTPAIVRLRREFKPSTELAWTVSRTDSWLECFTVLCLAKLSPITTVRHGLAASSEQETDNMKGSAIGIIAVGAWPSDLARASCSAR